MTIYKVAEVATVTDEALEKVLNEWSAQGWTFDGIHFVMREGSRRPAMAFVIFTGTRAEGDADG
jgi:hypothetical protein